MLSIYCPYNLKSFTYTHTQHIINNTVRYNYKHVQPLTHPTKYYILKQISYIHNDIDRLFNELYDTTTYSETIDVDFTVM